MSKIHRLLTYGFNSNCVDSTITFCLEFNRHLMAGFKRPLPAWMQETVYAWTQKTLYALGKQ